jgi:hypothetical protein
MSSDKTIVHVLPHPVLDPIAVNGTPTPFEVRNLTIQVYANAGSVESAIGGGNHGHLGSVMPDAEYTAITAGEPWVPPDWPLPLALGALATPAEISQAEN